MSALDLDYDVIVIGCGIAGATTGALCAEAGLRVLVLEQATQVGGRATSFRGEGIRDTAAFKRTLGQAAQSWITDRCEPGFDSLVEKRMLDGYVLESGARGSWFTNRGRVSWLMQHFNKPSNFYPNVGFVRVDGDGVTHEVVPGQPFGWMSKEDLMATAKIEKGLRALGDFDAARAYDRHALGAWMRKITANEKALEFHANRCTFSTVLNDADLNTVGGTARVVRISHELGVSFAYGVWGFAGSPGHRHLVENLVDQIVYEGGEVVTGAVVDQIRISGGRVGEVEVTVNGDRRTIGAKEVVCTVPPRQLPSLLDVSRLDEPYQIAAERTVGAGVVTAYMGLSRPITDFNAAIAPRAFIWNPVIARADEGFRGDVPLVGVEVSSIAPTRAPEGKHLAVWAANVLQREAQDPDKVELVIDRMWRFFDRAFPGFREALDWITFSVASTALCWRLPADPKPDIDCGVQGLRFAGDAYGERCNCGGIESACQSGMLCAEAITGRELRSRILPEIQV